MSITTGGSAITFPNSTTQSSASKILQVVSTNLNTTTSTTSTTPVTIAGLSATITPLFSTSKILVLVQLVAGGNPVNALSYYILNRNTIPVGVGASASGYTSVSVNNQRSSYDTNSSVCVNWHYLDNPATTSALTYTVQWNTESGNTTYLNRTGADATGFTYTARGASNITLMEVAA